MLQNFLHLNLFEIFLQYLQNIPFRQKEDLSNEKDDKQFSIETTIL